jgi:NAD(P)-dependent dehydrogenase (short-subunit alcohol dehydrogenase family)
MAENSPHKSGFVGTPNKGAVLITGASTGIGEATALRLAAGGFVVYAGVRKEADGAALKEKATGSLFPILIDVTDAASIDAARETLMGELGDGGLRGLVNNAGISGGTPIEFAPMDAIRRMFDVNFFGVIAVIQAFLPQVRKARGRIVVTGSIGGRMSTPFVAPYSATKHALEALCDAIRLELRPWGINVSLVEPGAIATPIWERSTAASMEQLAQMPPEALELYGNMIARLTKISEQQAAAGAPPDIVARAIEHALTASRPKARYLVGRDARLQAVLRRLPDRARDAMVGRYMGIPKPS